MEKLVSYDDVILTILKLTMEENEKNAEQNTRKAKYIIYDFGEDLPAVNAGYLLDILTAFPEAKAFMRAGDIGMVSAIYFEAEGGDGVLLPLRK